MIYRRGKLRPDPTRIHVQARDVLRGVMQVQAPPAYNVDAVWPGATLQLWLNDQLGDCVVASIVNWFIREELRNGRVLAPTDDEVRAFYFAQTGGEDTGLNMADTLDYVRDYGITLGGQLMKIGGYAQVALGDFEAIRQAIVHPGIGIVFGAVVDDEDEADFSGGLEWDTPTPDSTEGRHALYCGAYDPTGLKPETWARVIQTTYEWDRARMDECYAVWPLDHPAVDQVAYMQQVEALEVA